MEEDQTAVEEVSTTRRKRKREARGENGPWKCQIIDAITAVEKKLDAVLKAVEKQGVYSDTARKLSEAGKKSAAARKAKFGSAEPVRSSLGSAAGLNGVENRTAAPADVQMDVEQVREPVQQIIDLPGHSEPVRKPRAEKPQTSGALVWGAYWEAYRQRHGCEPIRNAKVNGQMSSLVKQVGVAEAVDLVSYYVSRNDAFYINAKHPLGLLLLDLQKLRTEQLQGAAMTMTDARRHEAHSRTDSAIAQYASQQEATARARCKACLDRGWYPTPGRADGQRTICGCRDTEQVREQVHVKEVKNAAQ